MFSSGPNYNKLKTNLRLAINRLKLSEKKKTEMALKSRKEIADYIAGNKVERAKIRVEHIIREDYMVEAMEVLEMYCDLLLARFGLIQQMKTLDDGLAEAISSLIWVAPRLQVNVLIVTTLSSLIFKIDVLDRHPRIKDSERPADGQVREAVRPGVQGEQRGDGVGQADAQAQRAGPAQDHRGEILDRDRQVLQRGVRARPAGHVPGRGVLSRLE